MKTACNYSQMTDLELFHLMQQGDEKAFTHIYNKYAHVLYVFALCYLKNEAAAEDAVQHIFMHLWEYREKVNVAINLKRYLYTAVKNHVLNYIRNQQTALLKNIELYNSQRYVDDNLETLLEKEQISTLLGQAIADLQHEKKQQIVKFRRDGLSNKEVAQLLGIPENTVKTYYAQGVKLLRDRLKDIISIIILLCLR